MPPHDAITRDGTSSGFEVTMSAKEEESSFGLLDIENVGHSEFNNETAEFKRQQRRSGKRLSLFVAILVITTFFLAYSVFTESRGTGITVRNIEEAGEDVQVKPDHLDYDQYEAVDNVTVSEPNLDHDTYEALPTFIVAEPAEPVEPIPDYDKYEAVVNFTVSEPNPDYEIYLKIYSEGLQLMLSVELNTKLENCRPDAENTCLFRYFINGDIMLAGFLEEAPLSMQPVNSNSFLYVDREGPHDLGRHSLIKGATYFLEVLRDDFHKDGRCSKNKDSVFLVSDPLKSASIDAPSHFLDMSLDDYLKTPNCTFHLTNDYSPASSKGIWIDRKIVLEQFKAAATSDNALFVPSFLLHDTNQSHVYFLNNCQAPWISKTKLVESIPKPFEILILGTSRMRVVYNDIARLFESTMDLPDGHGGHQTTFKNGTVQSGLVFLANAANRIAGAGKLIDTSITGNVIANLDKSFCTHDPQKHTFVVISVGIWESRSAPINELSFEGYAEELIAQIRNRCGDEYTSIIVVSQQSINKWHGYHESGLRQEDRCTTRDAYALYRFANPAWKNVARRHGFAFVDAEAATMPRREATPDHTHYYIREKGRRYGNEVAQSVTQMILHAMIEEYASLPGTEQVLRT